MVDPKRKLRTQRPHDDRRDQSRKFVAAARELGADQPEETFNDALRKLAKAPARMGEKPKK